MLPGSGRETKKPQASNASRDGDRHVDAPEAAGVKMALESPDSQERRIPTGNEDVSSNADSQCSCAPSACWALEWTRQRRSRQELAGVVRDTTGNVLPGVRLTVTGGPPAASQTVVTDDDGRYALDSIPLGHYLVTGALGGFAPRTIAVDVDDDSTTLDLVLAVSSFSETMTVTATKTGAVDIDSTPIAVTVVPARTLEQLEIHTVEDLAGLVPAVTISQHTGAAQVTIRGIGTNSTVAGADPSSTVHLDGVYLGRPVMALMEFVNVERVEVLRGRRARSTGATPLAGRSTSSLVSRPMFWRRAVGSRPVITDCSARKARSVVR